ncbi:reverse transcriptase domain-containing protein [Tanacetum coccineum]|uniref:Reverse transcriptase domain-containing protein n=1 Tax=Tanacetum coccineum TaxID=301880 RepID=A0ABQ5EKP3_9ASTR
MDASEFHPVCKSFDVLASTVMGPFPSSEATNTRHVAVDYLSKWVEAKALPTNDARVVYKFLKSLFARFGAPRAIISDRELHFARPVCKGHCLNMDHSIVSPPRINPDNGAGCPGFLKSLVLFVLRSQELHNPQLHLGIPIS